MCYISLACANELIFITVMANTSIVTEGETAWLYMFTCISIVKYTYNRYLVNSSWTMCLNGQFL